MVFFLGCSRATPWFLNGGMDQPGVRRPLASSEDGARILIGPGGGRTLREGGVVVFLVGFLAASSFLSGGNDQPGVRKPLTSSDEGGRIWQLAGLLVRGEGDVCWERACWERTCWGRTRRGLGVEAPPGVTSRLDFTGGIVQPGSRKELVSLDDGDRTDPGVKR